MNEFDGLQNSVHNALSPKSFAAASNVKVCPERASISLKQQTVILRSSDLIQSGAQPGTLESCSLACLRLLVFTDEQSDFSLPEASFEYPDCVTSMFERNMRAVVA